MPKVTVLLTSYNHDKYIKDAIESVMNQTFSNWEMIVVDDFSTDTSWEIIDGYEDVRIKKIRNPKNMGPEVAFDIMMEEAAGEYIAILHSDDVWCVEKLQKQVEYLDENRSIGAVFTGVNIIDKSGDIIQSSWAMDLFETQNRDRFGWLKRFFENGNCLCHPSVMIRKDLYKKCGMAVNGLVQIPDFYKWIRLCMFEDIHILPEKLTMYRVLESDKNTSAPSVQNSIRRNVESVFVYKNYFELSEDDVKKVFDESKEYFTGTDDNVIYVLCRIFLWKKETRILAIEKLFELINNDETRDQLQKTYGFGFWEFAKITKETDVFHIKDMNLISENTINSGIATLFYDTGEGFNTDQSVCEKYCVDGDSVASVEFDIPSECDIQALRFDPYEGKYIIAGIKEFSCDGHDESTELNRDDDFCKNPDMFFTMDPQYKLRFSDKKRIKTVKVEFFITTNFDVGLKKYNRLNEDVAYHFENSKRISQVYIDMGAGFTKENCITAECFADRENMIHRNFDISKFKNISSVRFDPCSTAGAVKIEKISFDGELYSGSVKSNAKIAGKFDIFINDDPQYIYTFPKVKNIRNIEIVWFSSQNIDAACKKYGGENIQVKRGVISRIMGNRR